MHKVHRPLNRDVGHMMKKYIVIALLLTTSAWAGIRGPGDYCGTVVFDRWGGCTLFSGIYLMYISTNCMDALRPYEGQAVQIKATDVFQPINPGDGNIRSFQFLGPAPTTPRCYDVTGLTQDLNPTPMPYGISIALTIRNEGTNALWVPYNEWGWALLVPYPTPTNMAYASLSETDGPSIAWVTRRDFNPHWTNATSILNGQIGWGDRTGTWQTVHTDDPNTRDKIIPGKARGVTLNLTLPPGEYAFISGFGGGVHECRCLTSDLLAFDIQSNGTCRIIGVKNYSKETKGQQAGAAYPPQGVGSADP